MSGRLLSFPIAVAAGVLLGVLATLTPVAILAALIASVTIVAARRNLPADERRILTSVLVAALLVRVLVVAGIVAASLPLLSDQSGGLLFGDEAYAFEKALRTRNLVLGFPANNVDYITVAEPYTKTRYADWLAWIQLTFGPTAFAVRTLNGVLFVAGGALMYRTTRRGFGRLPALVGLVTLLFLPSFLFWSVSLLKESAFFFLTAAAFPAAIVLLQGAGWKPRAAAAAALAAALWAVSDMRVGAAAFIGGGLLAGLALREITASNRRALAATALAVVAFIVIVATPAAHRPILRLLTMSAQQQASHVATPGHAYRTQDDRFYTGFLATVAKAPMTRLEAGRYIVRSAVSFVAEPTPWHVESRFEAVFMPEQLVWYAIAVLAVVGVPAAWRRDPLLASILAGYIVPMAALIALTNGNVGTLIRLREIVSHFVVWFTGVGLAILLPRAAARRAAAR